LGLELLDQKYEDVLHKIKSNYSTSPIECCSKMFHLWLDESTNATWDQLIKALRAIGLNMLAHEIAEMLIPEEHTHPNAGTCTIYRGVPRIFCWGFPQIVEP